MQVKLMVIGGKANRKDLSLKLPVIVGRSRTAGLTISHPMVSRQHCEIFEDGGLLRIRDLGSTNGTYVGGNKVEQSILRPRDQITVGPLTFEVEYEYAGDTTIIEERYQDYAGAARATVLDPEARAAAGEPEPWATPLPEDEEPSEVTPGASAEVAEPSAVAESESEGLEFLQPPEEPIHPAAAAQAADEGFEFLEPSTEPPVPVAVAESAGERYEFLERSAEFVVPAQSPDEGFALVETPPEPFEPIGVDSVADAESLIEPPVESFEFDAVSFRSDDSAEEFVSAEEPEPMDSPPHGVAAFHDSLPDVIVPPEPPAEFAQPGPEVPAMEFSGIAPPDGEIPDFSAWSRDSASEAPALGIGNAEGLADSAAPPGFELPPNDEPAVAPPPQPNGEFLGGEVPVWGSASDDSQSEAQGLNALESEPNPWEDSTGEAQTAPFVPTSRPGKPKTKKGWWPFGKRKAEGRK
jgi:hypothetical protein